MARRLTGFILILLLILPCKWLRAEEFIEQLEGYQPEVALNFEGPDSSPENTDRTSTSSSLDDAPLRAPDATIKSDETVTAADPVDDSSKVEVKKTDDSQTTDDTTKDTDDTETEPSDPKTPNPPSDPDDSDTNSKPDSPASGEKTTYANGNKYVERWDNGKYVTEIYTNSGDDENPEWILDTVEGQKTEKSGTETKYTTKTYDIWSTKDEEGTVTVHESIASEQQVEKYTEKKGDGYFFIVDKDILIQDGVKTGIDSYRTVTPTSSSSLTSKFLATGYEDRSGSSTMDEPHLKEHSYFHDIMDEDGIVRAAYFEKDALEKTIVVQTIGDQIVEKEILKHELHFKSEKTEAGSFTVKYEFTLDDVGGKFLEATAKDGTTQYISYLPDGSIGSFKDDEVSWDSASGEDPPADAWQRLLNIQNWSREVMNSIEDVLV